MSTATTEIIARAVIRDGDKLLVARERGKKWVFLPGGHVEPGEPVEAALIREIAEELGTGATVLGMVAVIEHGYVDDDRNTRHEINLVFDVALDGQPLSQEPHLEFDWLPTNQLTTTDLRPGALREAIHADARSTWHRWTGHSRLRDTESRPTPGDG
ncbi:NUDIX domain-containing protein [Nocardia vulneris]|uniref:NUDIX domain-containing protein n=1 Tax=Nocardia vulneris TaxID=1141657 RepID=UPI0009E18C3B|nr:NUDIX domain-containing protein [Nocardia vulneris]